MGNKKELSPEQREELLRALKGRLRKTWTAIKVLEWAKVQASWKLILKKCGRSMKWKELAVNLMFVGHDNKTGEYIFLWLFSGKS